MEFLGRTTALLLTTGGNRGEMSTQSGFEESLGQYSLGEQNGTKFRVACLVQDCGWSGTTPHNCRFRRTSNPGESP
jgi:hypothetical protein